MKALRLSLLAAVGSLALAAAADAQEVSFNVGAATDYVYRGVSQTDEEPQVFGGVDLALGEMGYAGVWASNVDFLDSTDAEVDVYAGVAPSAGPVLMDLGVIYYGYIDAPSGADYDFWEFKAAGSVPAGPATVGAAVHYSPDFFGGVGDAFYYEVNGEYGLNDRVVVSGAVGYQQLEGPGDYATWNLGVGFALTDMIAVDLRYHDTDEHDFGDYYESRVVLGVSAGF